MARPNSVTTTGTNQPQTKEPTTKHRSSHSTQKERQLIYRVLTSIKALNRRQISKITGLEITTLCRVLNEMVYNHKTVKVNHLGKCPVAKRSVMFYSLNILRKEVDNG